MAADIRLRNNRNMTFPLTAGRVFRAKRVELWTDFNEADVIRIDEIDGPPAAFIWRQSGVRDVTEATVRRFGVVAGIFHVVRRLVNHLPQCYVFCKKGKR